jgi:hypothetical protein
MRKLGIANKDEIFFQNKENRIYAIIGYKHIKKSLFSSKETLDNSASNLKLTLPLCGIRSSRHHLPQFFRLVFRHRPFQLR